MILSNSEYTDVTGPGIRTSKTKIVEIIGPPGIGKSTMYKSLCKKWTAQSNWIFPDRLLSLTESTKQNKFWPEYQIRKLLNKENKAIPVDFGLRYVDNNKELAQFLWNHLCFSNTYDSSEISQLYRSVYFLFKDFCRYQAIWETNFNKPCIIDEGLLEKSFFVLPDENVMIDLMNAYLPLLPLPHAIIFVNTSNIDVIADRLLNRKKVIASHIGKDRKSLEKDIERWQFLFGIIIRQMEKYNVPVYNIDGLKPIDEKVSMLNEIFK
jgi:hypothetical protein